MKTKKLNRRNFIGLTVIGSTALIIQNTGVKAQRKVRVRYNIISTDPTAIRNVENLKKAVGIMKKLPESNYCSWIAQAKIHKDFCPHYSSLFLPWHRAYLFYFEEICRKLLKEASVPGYDEFALPYWDWTNSPQMPTIFQTDSLRNDTRPPCGWITEPFNHERHNQPNESANRQEVGQTKIDEILGKRFEGVVFGTGTGQLESGPHSHIHVGFIKGNMGARETAALDPIFWIHHANIDRLWVNWMRAKIKRTPSPNCRIECISKNPSRIQKWLLSNVEGFYDASGMPTNPQVCSLLNTFDPNIFDGGYHYDDNHTPTVFDDCVVMDKNNVLGYFIRGEVGNDKTAKINGSVRVKVANFTEIPETLSNALKSFLTKKVTASVDSSPALLLTIEVEKPKTPQISVKVFLNVTKDLGKLPVSSPEYVATFTFFESSGENHQHGDKSMKIESRKFTFDVTDTILKLSESKLFTFEEAAISIYPISLSDEKSEKNEGVRLISFEFDLIGYKTELIK